MSAPKPGPQRPNEGGMDLRRYRSLLLSHSTAFCLITAAVVLGALACSYAWPKKYQATSTVSVEQNVVSDLVKGIAVTPSMDAKLRILNVSLLSRNRLLSVASMLDMDLNAKTPEQKERLVTALRANVTITREEQKGLFFISYTDDNPALARDFVNTIIRQYIEESTASKRKESFEATSFLSDQILVYQKRIEQAQQDIDAFKARRGMYLGLNEQLLRQQIKETEERLESIRIQKDERLAKLELAGTGSRMRIQLQEKELRLQTLLGTYTERHPAVTRTKEEIRALKAGIAENGDGEAAKAEYSAEQQKIQVELQSLQETEKNLKAKLDLGVKDLQELPAIRTELAELEQRKQNETAIYHQLVARLGQSEVSKQMELQDKAVTFNVIDAAVLPVRFVSPKRPLIIVGGICLGLGLAAGILFLADLARGTIRSRHDVTGYGHEVLALLPRLSMPAYRRGKRRRRGVVYATAALLFAACGIALLEFLNLPYVEKVIHYAERVFA